MASSQHPVYAVLLAAGSGSRFGGNKLLAELNGRPLIAHAATTLAEAISGGLLAGGIAVVPPGATAVAWMLDTAGLSLIENPDPRAGLSSSLRLGVSGLVGQWASGLGTAGILVVLADQPHLRPDVITKLIAAWRSSGRSVRPRYADSPDTPGHPVLLDSRIWPLVENLSGDAGLRDVLNEQPVLVVDVEGGNPDVDTPADLEGLR